MTAHPRQTQEGMKQRELKFRAWDGEQVRQPVGVGYEGAAFEVVSGNPGGCADPDCCSQIPDEIESDGAWVVMQYTGLKDRDGVDTYEGDIVDHPDGGLCVVKFADGHFYAEDQAPGHCLGFDLDRCAYKVIGNIHENPELLKP